MAQKIYGLDLNSKFNTIDVRDAIIICFTQAHNEILAQELKDFSSVMEQSIFERLKQMNVAKMVHSVFEELGLDFKKPTKQGLIKVCDQLADYSKQFRSPEIIKKHYAEIMLLINKL